MHELDQRGIRGAEEEVDVGRPRGRRADVRVRVGQIVVWRNEDNVRHTVTSGTPGGPDSAQLNPGDRFEWTARRPGTVRYSSLLKPDVRGVLGVGP